MSSRIAKIILCAALTIAGVTADGVSRLPVDSVQAEAALSQERIVSDLEYLCGEECEGRGSGTKGGALAAKRIAMRFEEAKLIPFDDSHIRPFESEEGKDFANVLGMLPAFGAASADKYIVVAAHYDGLADRDGVHYPGADSNASGVVALDEIAAMFSYLFQHGRIYPQNLLFVALDGKQDGFAGSEMLWDDIINCDLKDPLSGKPLKGSSITLFVNLDILGGTSFPPASGKSDYLIMLSEDEKRESLLREANSNYNTDLDLAMDYHGSKGFTEMFYRRISDQKIFLENEIPSVMFTSGISYDTNRPTDTVRKIDQEILIRRTKLIFHFLERSLYTN